MNCIALCVGAGGPSLDSAREAGSHGLKDLHLMDEEAADAICRRFTACMLRGLQVYQTVVSEWTAESDDD